MRTTKRIYRTADGTLVPEGHLDATYLAYGEGDEVENRDADAVKAILDPKPAPTRKQAPKAADKQAAKSDDK